MSVGYMSQLVNSHRPTDPFIKVVKLRPCMKFADFWEVTLYSLLSIYVRFG
jgi:hypothetical protein